MITRRLGVLKRALMILAVPALLASCGEGAKPYDIAQSEYLSLNPAQMTAYQAAVRDAITNDGELRFNDTRAVVHPKNGYLIVCGLVSGETKAGHAVKDHLVYAAFEKDPSPWGDSPKVATVDGRVVAGIECPRLGLSPAKAE